MINNSRLNFLKRWGAAWVASALLSACGGGGGNVSASTQGQSNSDADVVNVNPTDPVKDVGFGNSFYVSTAPDQAVAVAQLSDKTSLLLLRVDTLPPQLKLVRLSSAGVVLDSQVVANAESHGSIGFSDLFNPSLKSDGGNVYIAWLHVIPSHYHSESYRELNVRTYNQNSGLSPVRKININNNGSVLSYKMEASSDGNAWVAWVEVNPVNPIDSFRGPASIYAESIQGGGAASRLEIVSSLDPDVSSVALGVSASGRVAVAWPVKNGNYQVAIRSVIRSTDGVWSPPATFYQSTEADCYYGFTINDLQIDVDRFGNAIAVWSLGSWACQTGGVAYSYFDSQLGWGSVGFVSNSGLQPHLAMNDDGQGVLVWIDIIDDGYAVFAGRFDRSGGYPVEAIGRREFPYGEISIYSQTASMVAINEAGSIAITWNQDKYVNGPSLINSRFFSEKNGWSSVRGVSIAKVGEGVLQDAISAAQNGDISLIWRQGDLTGGDGRSHSWLTRVDVSLIE